MCPQQPTLGSVCRGATLSLTSPLSPQLPSHQLLFPHPTLSSKNTAEAEEFSTTPTATVSHWREEKTEFWVRVPPSCPAEGRERDFSYSSTVGQATHPPLPAARAPGLKDDHEAGLG